jgi:hypothetical protein
VLVTLLKKNSLSVRLKQMINKNHDYTSLLTRSRPIFSYNIVTNHAMLYLGSSHSPAVASRSYARYIGQVHRTAKARNEPTYDKKLYSRIRRLLRVEALCY